MNKEIFLNSIYSDGSKYFVSNPLPKMGEKIVIAVQMLENADVCSVYLQAKYNGVPIPKKMTCVASKNGISRYELEVQVFGSEFQYFFVIVTKNRAYYYSEAGISTYLMDEARLFRLLIDYKMPEWVKNTVFYQIFPERFCNGDETNDVKDDEYVFEGFPCKKVKNWNTPPAEYNEAHCLDFYGGDLQGIIQKIPYLKKLGVNAIYLNPIFYAATVHKYDCLDYFHVDPHFGGDEALAELTKVAHKNGIKVMLDVSINHTGTANKWFNKDCVFFPKSEGAYNNPESEERNFYFFGKNDENGKQTYKSWFDVESLPTLNYTSQKLRGRLYRDEDSVVKKWLKKPYSIDAWRFDVADTMARNNELQLQHEVWPEIRKSIKEENENAYILAEDWSDCSEFLNGNEWDSQMNYYGSSFPIREFYGQKDFHSLIPEKRDLPYKMTSRDLSNWITGFLSRLPYQIRSIQFNLLDSHDTPRFHNDKNITHDAVRGAVLMIFTLPGCTNIYYGDEAEIDGRIESMEGCRYPMPWNKNIEETETYKFYSKLIALKTNDEAFKDGGFKVVWENDYVFAFARFTPEKLYFTILSSDTQERTIELPLEIFGDNFSKMPSPKTDALGEKIDAEIKNGNLFVKVPSGKAFLIGM